MDLSVIIPIYNTEKYLKQCIDSVLYQKTKYKYEIILVDDGSTDKSGIICDEYDQKNHIVRVIHKKNGGLMSAWKSGMKIAKGEFIGFVDSDDWIDNTMYDVLLTNAKESNCDMVCCSYIQEFLDGNKKHKKLPISGKYLNYYSMKNELYPKILYDKKSKDRLLQASRATKIFRCSTLREIICYCSDDITIGEDLLTTFAFVTKANAVMFLPDFYPYHYRILPQSMIHKYSREKYNCIKKLKKKLEDVDKNCNYDFSEQINIDFLNLMIRQLDHEMIYSDQSTKELIVSFKKFYSDTEIKNALSNINTNILPQKSKVYLYLLKLHLYNILILIRKINNFRNKRSIKLQ